MIPGNRPRCKRQGPGRSTTIWPGRSRGTSPTRSGSTPAIFWGCSTNSTPTRPSSTPGGPGRWRRRSRRW